MIFLSPGTEPLALKFESSNLIAKKVKLCLAWRKQIIVNVSSTLLESTYTTASSPGSIPLSVCGSRLFPV